MVSRQARLKKLEERKKNRVDVRVGASFAARGSDELEDYLGALENCQAELQGKPPPHDLREEYDPELEAYFQQLEEQERHRNWLLGPAKLEGRD